MIALLSPLLNKFLNSVLTFLIVQKQEENCLIMVIASSSEQHQGR